MAQTNRMKQVSKTMNASDIQQWGDGLLVRLDAHIAKHPATVPYIEEFPLPPEPDDYLTENELEEILREPLKTDQPPF